MADFQMSDKAAVGTPAVTDVHLVAQAGVVKRETTTQILSLITSSTVDYIAAGWKAETNTWTYISADANFPQFIFSVNADATGYLYKGQKIKLTQTSTKYFIIVNVGTFGGGVTLVTIYGGGTQASPSYTLADAAITTPYYATTYRPLDFPYTADLWTTIYTSSSTHNKATATGGIYYGGANDWDNGGDITTYFGIGLWDIDYFALMHVYVGDYYYTIALSSSDDAVSTTDLQVQSYTSATRIYLPCARSKQILLTDTTQYWLLQMVNTTGYIAIRGDKTPIVIRARCLYL